MSGHLRTRVQSRLNYGNITVVLISQCLQLVRTTDRTVTEVENVMLTAREGHAIKKIDINRDDALSLRSPSCDEGEIVSCERYFDRVGGRLRRYQVSEYPNQNQSLLQDTIDGVDGVVSKDGRWIVSHDHSDQCAGEEHVDERGNRNKRAHRPWRCIQSPDSTNCHLRRKTMRSAYSALPLNTDSGS